MDDTEAQALIATSRRIAANLRKKYVEAGEYVRASYYLDALATCLLEALAERTLCIDLETLNRIVAGERVVVDGIDLTAAADLLGVA